MHRAAFLLLTPTIILAFSACLDAQEAVTSASPGPWGEIEYYETILEVPDGRIRAPHLSTTTEWTFEGMTRAAAVALMRSSGVSNELLDLATADNLWSQTAQGAKLTPPDGLILGLLPEVRARLYAVLRNHPQGQFAQSTFGIERGDFRVMARDFPIEIIELIERLSYQHGGLREIADTPFLLSQISDPGMQRRVVRALCRTRSVIPRLRVGPNADIEALANYWSGPDPDRDLRPLLESVRDAPGAEFVDIFHLLPPNPRKYLGSYTNFRDTFHMEYPDCFWAALNFFEPQPNQRIHDNLSVSFYITPEKFEQVPEGAPHTFGDTFVLQNQTFGFIHAYVLIADDLVFTKNGNSNLFPWLIMRREDMLARYSHHGEMEVHVFRRRAPSAQLPNNPAGT
ncbi:MAG: hypothetical protein ACI8UO_006750 [Verrucomicrobiales bacterium]|jgi:hypothetical protein